MLVNVYEVVNKTLKEVYLGGSELPVDKLLEFHRRSPPPAIAHWDFSKHRIVYSEIEHALPQHDIGLFIESYDLSTPMPGWKTYKEK